MAFSCLRCYPELLVQDQEQLYLPSGYRFAPQNHELVLHYLARKFLDQKLPANIITTLDLYQYDPNQLPISDFKYGKPNEAYVFSKLEYRQSEGLPRRTTKSGYWKATGRSRTTKIFHKKTVVGFKRNLNFHWGKAPTGKSSPWIMHEFRVNPSLIPAAALNNNIGSKVESYVVCKIHCKELEDSKPPSKAKSKKITKPYIGGNETVNLAKEQVYLFPIYFKHIFSPFLFFFFFAFLGLFLLYKDHRKKL